MFRWLRRLISLLVEALHIAARLTDVRVILGLLLRVISVLVQAFDNAVRQADLRVNRTFGGPFQRLAIERHPVAAVFLPTALVFVTVNGPSPGLNDRLLAAVVLSAASAVLFTSALRVTSEQRAPIWVDFGAQTFFLLVIAVAVWRIARPEWTEHSGAIYRHVFIPTAALAMCSAVLAPALTAKWFRAEKPDERPFAAQLALVELFSARPDSPSVTWPIIGVAALNALTSTPWRVLLPPSIAVLFVPRGAVYPSFIFVALANIAVLAFANIDTRFGAALTLPNRVLFRGWATPVSTIVVCIGVARLLDIQYVSTLFDGARNATIFGYLLSAYILAWWYDYWVSAIAVSRVLNWCGTWWEGRVNRVAYAYRVLNPPLTKVPGDERFIQAHGSGRVLVVRSGTPREFFNAYDAQEFLAMLGQQLPDDSELKRELVFTEWKIGVHLLVANVLLGVFLAAAAWGIYRMPQTAHIPEPTAAGAPALSLTDLLASPDTCRPEQSIIALAASGGGTRAAVYTASILERLHGAHLLDRVRVVSGVSGGGAALAYFVGNREDLVKNSPIATSAEVADHWNRYFSHMKYSYIEDVIDASAEWRIATNERLGRLLAESFAREWQSTRQTLGEVKDIGILLNSSIAGRFVREPDDRSGLPLAVLERDSLRGGSSDVAGGRLVFTNLALSDHINNAPLLGEPPPQVTRDGRLPVFIVNHPSIALADAAAASANFPPVFPNTAIDRDRTTRFWVTDGGAVDNRGTETLLMAIRSALFNAGRGCERLPVLHIIEVEASAFSDGYRQDRGIGSMMAAGAAFASQLDSELLASIKMLYASWGQDPTTFVQFHYMPMPAALRQSGSFGTHWMLQRYISVCRDANCRTQYDLTGDEVVTILRALSTGVLPAGVSDTVKAAFDLVKKDSDYAENWSRLFALMP